jgi:hypothetical protein
MARVLHWNGRDLPEELQGLPPGRYVLEDDPDEAPTLAPEEDAGLRAALESVRAGRVRDVADVRASIEKKLSR